MAYSRRRLSDDRLKLRIAEDCFGLRGDQIHGHWDFACVRMSSCLRSRSRQASSSSELREKMFQGTSYSPKQFSYGSSVVTAFLTSSQFIPHSCQLTSRCCPSVTHTHSRVLFDFSQSWNRDLSLSSLLPSRQRKR